MNGNLKQLHIYLLLKLLTAKYRLVNKALKSIHVNMISHYPNRIIIISIKIIHHFNKFSR